MSDRQGSLSDFLPLIACLADDEPGRKSIIERGSDMSEENLLDVKQVAEYLQLKASTIYTWAQDGKIPANKVGRTWQFIKDDVDRWLEEHLLNTDTQ